MRFSDLATLASALTALRILLAAAFPLLPEAAWLPVYLFALATDVADGAVARARREANPAGATLDAWADKILQVNVAWTLVNHGIVPAWWLLCWFARELLQVPMIFALVHRWRIGVGRPKTRALGRATTLALSVTGALALTGHPSLPLTVLVGVLGSMAGIDYARVHFQKPTPSEVR